MRLEDKCLSGGGSRGCDVGGVRRVPGFRCSSVVGCVGSCNISVSRCRRIRGCFLGRRSFCGESSVDVPPLTVDLDSFGGLEGVRKCRRVGLTGCRCAAR